MSNQIPDPPRREYRKRRRAQQESETRDRITEAAVKLHGTVGPARTTVKGVAEEAGVQRATVYRHFPDLRSLFTACSTHWANLNPPPDPGPWRQIADPNIRLRQALNEVYEWYGWAEPMLTNVFRDAPAVPAMAPAIEDFEHHFNALHQALMSGRKLGAQTRITVAAAIGHSLAFPTWQSLVRVHGLGADEAAELMTALVVAAGVTGTPRTRSSARPV
jgi:AcrR family transcriptional regulator